MGGRCDLRNTGKLQAKGPTGAEFVKNADEGAATKVSGRDVRCSPGRLRNNRRNVCQCGSLPKYRERLLVNFRQLDQLSHFFRQFQSACPIKDNESVMRFIFLR